MLYAAADRLRQEGLDAAIYKDYIFGLLFLKRCSDVFEAEREKIVGIKVGQGGVREQVEETYGEDIVTAEQAELTKLRQLKSGLMTDLLEGRVRVIPRRAELAKRLLGSGRKWSPGRDAVRELNEERVREDGPEGGK